MPRPSLALALVLGVSALACKAEPVEAGPAAELAVVAPVLAEPKPQPGPVVAPQVSWATFNGTNLDVCVDVVVPPDPDRAASAERFAAESIANAGKSPKGEPLALRLEMSCAKQFSDRGVLATCTVGASDNGITMRVYNIVTLDDSDSYAKQCLSTGGDWRPNPEAIESARRQDSMKRLRRLAGN